MNIDALFDNLKNSKNKKSMPLLSFPSVQFLNCSVGDLVVNSDLQARGMKIVADKTPSFASVSYMDLSVEAEAFGAKIEFSKNDLPTVIEPLVLSADDAEQLRVPTVGEKRTGLYLEAVKKAKSLITDRPIFAGIIGCFSLAGRLLDVTEALCYCYTDPDLLHKVLKKCTDFLIEYAKAYKSCGADGIVIAEPLAGLLSPDLAAEFSQPYIHEICRAVKDENFAVIYHNCGNSAVQILDSILKTNCTAYHFGNAVNMVDVLKNIPSNVIAMGNIDPVTEFKNGSVDSIKTAVKKLLDECSDYPNFIISSGCDIPHDAKWENIDAYYQAIDKYYNND